VLAERLPRLLDAPGRAPAVLEALKPVFGLGPAPGVDAEQVAAALQALIRPRLPAAVLLDDLHWADPRSLEVLRLALPAWRSWPLLVVASYRPSLEERARSPLGRGDLRLRLGGLDEAAAREDLTLELATAALRRAAGTGWRGRQLDLLAHWRQGGHDPGSVPAYLALADDLASSPGSDPAAIVLSERYRGRARRLARELRLRG
jgi:hypothetical protein